MHKKRLFLLITLVLISVLSSAVLAQENFPRVTVSLLDYEPKPVQPGQVIDLTIQLDNLGSATEDASLEIIEEYPFTVEDSQDVDLAKDLGRVGYSRKLQFRIRIAEDAKDGITPLRVKYTDDNFQSGSGYIEKTFDIEIKTFDARIDVTEVKQVPKKLEPGEEGKVILTLQNTDDRPLKNIDITLDLTHSFDMNANMDNMLAMQAMVNARLEQVNRRVASGLSPLTGATPMMSDGGMGDGKGMFSYQAFSSVESTNQKTIKELRPRERVQVEFDIMALPDVSPNVYATPLFLNYNDEDNNPFHVRLDVPLMIKSNPDLYVDMKSTTLRTTDFAAEVVFTVANRGLSDLRYVTLELEEDETVTVLTAPKSIYIGDLSPGESKEGTYTILAEDEEINLVLKTDYRDSYNKQHQEEKIIPFTIINKNYYRDLPYEMWIAWIVLGLVVLALTGFYVWHMQKKKKE